MKPIPQAALRTVALLIASLTAQSVSAAPALPQGFERVELSVEDVTREALLYAPASAKEQAAPVVFVWHGHGGNMRNTVRSFAMNIHWPEAISVYAQGLNTPGRLTDPEGKKPGWQGRPGDQGDRDLKFFDALLAKVKADYKVDARRIYSTGHSNGGGFTYLLWATRGEVFAAMAPSSAASARPEQVSVMLKPKPAMHIAGEKDPLVKYEWQRIAMATVKNLNGCETEGKPWGPHCTLYESKSGTSFVTFIHAGGHEFHKDAPAAITRFFREVGVPTP